MKYRGSENFSLAAYLFDVGVASRAFILPLEALLWQVFEQYFFLSEFRVPAPAGITDPQKSQRISDSFISSRVFNWLQSAGFFLKGLL